MRGIVFVLAVLSHFRWALSRLSNVNAWPSLSLRSSLRLCLQLPLLTLYAPPPTVTTYLQWSLKAIHISPTGPWRALNYISFFFIIPASLGVSKYFLQGWFSDDGRGRGRTTAKTTTTWPDTVLSGVVLFFSSCSFPPSLRLACLLRATRTRPVRGIVELNNTSTARASRRRCSCRYSNPFCATEVSLPESTPGTPVRFARKLNLLHTQPRGLHSLPVASSPAPCWPFSTLRATAPSQRARCVIRKQQYPESPCCSLALAIASPV